MADWSADPSPSGKCRQATRHLAVRLGWTPGRKSSSHATGCSCRSFAGGSGFPSAMCDLRAPHPTGLIGTIHLCRGPCLGSGSIGLPAASAEPRRVLARWSAARGLRRRKGPEPSLPPQRLNKRWCSRGRTPCRFGWEPIRYRTRIHLPSLIFTMTSESVPRPLWSSGVRL